ncbi:DUF4382 domain-containing protein [Pseudidiomarina terrestris]|uniref:DUF4382 domain-containing protein n=1 Tax=Pseudidiomarina terrestris TaxID=2820060 RepID=UPI00264F5529|nr:MULTISPECIES: DUF4382 domain-containing protein [unclassified Pseudidiomarina]MDN7126416.1 DUF4382 domain-containing protein [Pseudidiomarina sp. 1APR75-33.1]MDN7135246.1 DUF4382 domain-containing protein [Pseudidiomarina sp. 1ASP75-5]
MLQNSLIRNIIVTSSVLVLAACGGSDDEDQMTRFSLAVSDAPVDSADAVVACFSAVELVGNGDESLTFTVGESANTVAANDVCKDANGDTVPNTHGVDLLSYTGSDSAALISGSEVPAGSYGQLRLVMATGSYVQVGDEQIPLSVPSNELKFDSFTLDAGGNVAYTVEFDLRQALVNPVGQAGYFLKPRGVRLVNNLEVGHVEGTVAEALLIENSCTVAPSDTTEPVAVVYFYEGSDLDVTTLADVGGAETHQPYAVAAVYFDNVSAYTFSVGYVAVGDYTAAWSCQTDDDPEADDDLTFNGTVNVTVNGDEAVTAVDISG